MAGVRDGFEGASVVEIREGESVQALVPVGRVRVDIDGRLACAAARGAGQKAPVGHVVR